MNEAFHKFILRGKKGEILAETIEPLIFISTAISYSYNDYITTMHKYDI